MQIKVRKLYPDSILPTKANLMDVGFDVYAHSFDTQDGSLVIYLGIAVEPPEGYYFELAPRSSISKTPWVFANSIGIIDPNYRGELQVRMKPVHEIDGNTIKYRRIIDHGFMRGDRVGQLILRKHEGQNFEIVETDNLSLTQRGEGGFGSTGK
jgi:dUTP pyrophosphatase